MCHVDGCLPALSGPQVMRGPGTVLHPGIQQHAWGSQTLGGTEGRECALWGSC